MAGNDHQTPTFATLARRFGRTGLGALRNRGELFAVEWQEEKARLAELLIWCAGVIFFGTMALIILTGTVIFLLPEELRIYAAVGFILLYLVGAIVAVVTVRGLLKHEPFAESIEQVKKDGLCFESLK
jgi:uncharacterized membrane protein YqjE